ncbi:response regulator transcription factor [Pigmentiphaga sp.]|uniref:response regulator transcription factor n=1 Tax=Pigmentiphaga sp. TaxID=1977564 RepID=UPI0012CE3ECD|nr:response regulator transcription factor [Pigmentiphaga sp.]MPS28670.1 response regulator transcription factor [Alcaligenaceae bacterium SAGV5]MPS52415.1 response regulator transcription factor [Alcaligenaceae bacterium SAGV3]MPT58114.1 response regulator transcription factor [Alcaligenaceae bacterium]
MRIAILEDDPAHARIIEKTLLQAGHDCHLFEDGRAMLRDLHRESYDMFVLDWHVPHIDGPEILGWIRRNLPPHLPVLFVTSRDEEQDVVDGLQAGADDYMTKPIRPFELQARVAALLRRAYPEATRPTQPGFGAYTFDLHRREVRLKGEAVELKPKEYELALYLFRNLGRLLTHEHLLEELWGTSAIDTRTVTTHMSQLRRKLDLRPHNGVRLVPVYGLGYRFEILADQQATNESNDDHP